MKNKIFFAVLLVIISFFKVQGVYADRDCTTLGASDYNTFKEYCYKITDSYLELRNNYEVNKVVDSYMANKILDYAKSGLNYLPDSLSNKNYYNKLKTAIEKGVKHPDDTTIFSEIRSTTEDFLNKTTVQEITGKVSALPAVGNAPLTVTLRADVKDPTGTKLENYNYTWWIQDGTRRKILGNRVFLDYTIREEGNYAIFLDVTSNHRNKQGNIDVLSFSEKVMIQVNEKVASTIIRVNSKSLGGEDTMKFTPEEGAYGLLVDATSSTPASGTKFVETQWDFGNGITKTYEGAPKVERVIYAVEGEYNVKLQIKTNSGSIVKRNFTLVVRNPIASIKSTDFEGFLGDKFTFSADTYVRDSNLTFAWEIVDLKKDAIIFNKSASTFSYNFPDKGRYNLKLTVTAPSGEMDYDNRIVYINSRPPVANFTHTVANISQPNRVFLDGSTSYDLDVSDNGKLKYNWIIDGNRVELDDTSRDGSSGYYTFPSIGNHDVVLEVLDPDDMVDKITKKVTITSILGVNFYSFPRVTQAGAIAKFVAESPEADYFEWNFGDNSIDGGKDTTTTHKYKKSGIYDVTLTVRDANENKNTITKKMYVGDSDTPLAFLSITDGKDPYGFETGACNGKGAYVVDRVSSVKFSATESIDVTGKNQGLAYSWKIGNKYYSKSDISRKFDELGCIPVKLTIRSEKSGKSDTKEAYVDVRNIKPTLSSLDIQVKDSESDPVVVKVSAVDAKDPDGVIQSYLWYYYTDSIAEPQDFRATRSNSTTFVMPRITGNYYFVVVMKDNNEERVKSEDITSRYFITLAGDNQNTPIIDLRASDTSISVGEEVTFTVTAKNILTKNILKDSKIYWDFDGDGFYDKETRKGTVTHKYTKAGENINAKVKVSHKGFSNTRNIQINVSNILYPDFDYTSIGNDVIFFNKSSGTIDQYIWDLGDGETVTNNGSFKYTYTDGKASHLVKLKVQGGGENKETSKEVVRNFKNFISAKKSELGFYSDSSINEGSIALEQEQAFMSLYITSNKKEVKNYAIDYDITSDSDLNGGDNDDYDNKNDASFYSGGPVRVPLNKYKDQKIRVMLLDEAGNILTSENITIVKSYVKEEPLNPNEITFENVPDAVKSKFEQIKSTVLGFPNEYKLKGLEYVKRLQEEWNDDRAKTKIILEFEGFIADAGVDPSGELIDLLESLLVESGDENNAKAIAAKALQNLVPKTITCPKELQPELTDTKICYDLLASKITAMKESRDIEMSKKLAEQVLSAIVQDKTMTTDGKLKFKAILKTLVYGGVGEIPEKEKQEVIDDTKNKKVTPPRNQNETTSTGGIMSVFISILTWIFYIILIIGLLIGGLFLVYKIMNKDTSKSFTDFLMEKTARKTESSTQQDVADVLAEGTETSNYDPLADFGSTQEKSEKPKENNTDFDWASFSNDPSQPVKKEQPKAPDWLKNVETDASKEVGEKNETTVSKTNVEKNSTENIQKKSKGAVPDWLKGSLDEKEETEKEQNKDLKTTPLESSVASSESELQTPLEVKEKDKKANTKVPDWLKGVEEEKEKTKRTQDEASDASTETKEKLEVTPDVVDAKEIDKKQDDNLIIKSGVPDWLKQSGVTEQKSEKEGEIKTDTKETEAQKQKSQVSKEQNKNIPNISQKTENKETSTKKSEGAKENKERDIVEPKLETKEEIEDFIKIEDESVPTKAGTKKGELPDWLVEKNEKKDNTKKSEKKTQSVETKKDVTTGKTTAQKRKTDKKEGNKQITKKKQEEKQDKEKFNNFDFETTKGAKKSKQATKTKEAQKTKEEKVKTNATTEKKINEKTVVAKKKDTKSKSIIDGQKKKDNVPKKEEKRGDELWDDGMKIPDWLKTD